MPSPDFLKPHDQQPEQNDQFSEALSYILKKNSQLIGRRLQELEKTILAIHFRSVWDIFANSPQNTQFMPLPPLVPNNTFFILKQDENKTYRLFLGALRESVKEDKEKTQYGFSFFEIANSWEGEKITLAPQSDTPKFMMIDRDFLQKYYFYPGLVRKLQPQP